MWMRVFAIMRYLHLVPSLILLSVCFPAAGQGTFIYDQQSSDESYTGEGAAFIQAQQPGQSFTPTFSSIGFIRLILADNTAGNFLGARVHVNLLSNSITGGVMASSTSVTMPDGFGRGSSGVVNFLFSSPADLVPGTTYFFQPVVEAGDTWAMASDLNFNYPGGTAYANGVVSSGWDLWFREGVVPEPSSGLLVLLGGVMIAMRRTRGG